MQTIIKDRKIKRTFKRAMSKLKMIKNIFAPVVSATRNATQKQILEKSLDFVSGLESPLENPDKLLDDKAKTLRLYDAMMLDDRISSIMKLKKFLTLSVNGEFVPGSDDEKDIEIKDFIQENLENMTIKWWDVLANWADAPQYGNKVGEKIFKMVDAKILLATIRFMHSIFFDFGYDEFGNLNRLEIGKNYGSTTVIKDDEIWNKFTIFVYPYLKDGNYYGDSDLREIYTLYYAKYQIFRFRNKFLQNYGQPIPVVYYDQPRTSTEEYNEMKDFLENFQDNMHLLIPGMRPKNMKDGTYMEHIIGKFEVTLLENKNTRGTDQYEKTIDQLDRQISRKLLVPDKMGFTQDQTGARNQSQEFFKVLKMVIKDMHGRLEDQANAVIKQLVDLNFPNVENYPTWQFEKIDQKIEVEMLKSLLEHGVIDKEEKWIRTFVGIPQLTEEEKAEIEERRAREREQTQTPPATPPTEPEQEKFKGDPAAKLDRIKKAFDRAEADFIRDYKEIHLDASQTIVKQVERKKIIENRDLPAIKKLRVNKTDFKRLLSLYYAKMYIAGKSTAIEEFKRKRSRVRLQTRPAFATAPPHTFLEGVDWLDRDWIDRWLGQYEEFGTLNPADITYLKELRSRAFFVTGDIEQRMLKDIHTNITSGLDNGMTTRTIINQIDASLANDRKKFAITIARTNAADAFNEGRMNFFTSDLARPFIEAYQYNAVLDDRTTPFCELHDGQVIRQDSPEFGNIVPPNHFNCRSILIPIMTGEGTVEGSPFFDFEEKLEPFGQGVPVAQRLPAAGFGGLAK